MRAALTTSIAILAMSSIAGAQGAREPDAPAAPAPAPQPVMTAAPEVLEASPPEYPAEAAEAGLEAVVKVRIHIDATGTVTKVDVIEPVGSGFDEAAQAAALKYKFKPAEWGNVPGPIVVETGINFVIEKVEVHPEPNWPEKTDPVIDPASIGPPERGGDVRKPVSISGVALERGNRRKLAGVIVSVSEIGLDVVTDASGNFYFHALRGGEYTIIAVADGFDRFSRKLVVKAGEEVGIRLYLRPEGGNPYQTIVEGEREVLEVTRRVLNREQLTSVPGTFGDPIRVVQTLPGLARPPFGLGFLIIRGSNPDDSGIFIDGHRVPLLFHFLGGPSVLNAEFLDTIELFPGGFPARYGRSSGGIVAIGTRSSKSDGVHGSADIDLLDSGAYLRTSVGKNGSFSIAGRRSYLNLLLPLFIPEPTEGNLVVVPIYFDYQARFDYDFGKEGKASAFVIGSGDRLDVLSDDPEDEEMFNIDSSIDFFRVILSYKRPITKDIELTLSPAWGRDSLVFASSQQEGGQVQTGFNLTQTVYSFRMGAKGKLFPNVIIDVGADIESRVSKYDITGQDDEGLGVNNDDANILEERFIRRFDSLLYGIHADVALTIGDLRLIPGLRLDGAVLAGINKLSADPRLVARYDIDKQWVTKGYVGLFTQPPNPEAFDQQFGNPNLGLERAIHTGVGAEYKPAKHWKLDGELYYINRQDQVRFTSDEVLDPATGRRTAINFKNSGISNTIGFEALIRREVTRNLYGWLSYTLSRTLTQRDPDNPRSPKVPTVFDQTHNLNLVASYKLGSGWELGGRFRLTSGIPETEITGGTFDADDGGYDSLRGEPRGIRGRTFHQLDVRAEKRWLFDTWSLSTYLDVQNIYNAANEEARQYDYRFRESGPVRGVPILPTLGVKGQF